MQLNKRLLIIQTFFVTSCFSCPLSASVIGDLFAQAPQKVINLCADILRVSKPNENLKYLAFPMAKKYLVQDFLVRYLSKQELEQSEIKYDMTKAKWFYLLSGTPVPAGNYIFVMSSAGEIFILPYDSDSRFHHSSFFHNGPVAAAGAFIFYKEGKLADADTITGHFFRSFPRSALPREQLTDELARRGFNDPEFKVYGF